MEINSSPEDKHIFLPSFYSKGHDFRVDKTILLKILSKKSYCAIIKSGYKFSF